MQLGVREAEAGATLLACKAIAYAKFRLAQLASIDECEETSTVGVVQCLYEVRAEERWTDCCNDPFATCRVLF